MRFDDIFLKLLEGEELTPDELRWAKLHANNLAALSDFLDEGGVKINKITVNDLFVKNRAELNADDTHAFELRTSDGTKVGSLYQDGAGNLQVKLEDATKAFTIENGNVIVNHATDVDGAFDLFENNSRKGRLWWDASDGNLSIENEEAAGSIFLVLDGGTPASEQLVIYDRNRSAAIATIDNDGVNIETGNTYMVNGARHTHDYSDVSGADGSTDITAAQLEELSDGSSTTLHAHAEDGITSPITTNMLCRDPDAVGKGTWAITVNTSHLFNGFFSNTTTVDGDNFTVNFYLIAGTYTLRFNASKSSNRGIVDVSVDGTEKGTVDLYAASLDADNIEEITGIVIASSGSVALKFAVDSKNASSSDYAFATQQIEWIKTA